jgi:hypothetical protein
MPGKDRPLGRCGSGAPLQEGWPRKVQVGESSVGMFDSIRNMKFTGIAPAAEREGAELIELGSEKTPTRTVPAPKGKVLR